MFEGELGGKRLQSLVRSSKLKYGVSSGTRKEAGIQAERKGLIGSNGSSQQMFSEASALVAVLKTCANQKNLCKGSSIHADILRRGLFGRNIYLGNSLVNLYAKCGVLSKAQEVFDELPVRNVVSWNTLIAGFVQYGRAEEALRCFKRMQQEGDVFPNAVTYLSILKACASIGAADKGKAIHDDIIREGLLEKSIEVGNALVDMYAKCGALKKAQDLFDKLPLRDVISWNSLIAGYAEHGHGEESLRCFERMRCEGMSPDAVTFVCILKACGSTRAADKGKKIVAEIVREGLLGKNIVVGNALVDMYLKCGELGKAQEVFDKLPVKDVVSWNVLMSGYTQHGHCEEALSCFERMQYDSFSPNAVTFVCALKACSSIGATYKGKEIGARIVREGWVEKDICVGTALLDMYAKCGVLAKAQEVFDKLPVRDVVSWNALITGYVQQGQCEEALNSFIGMQHEGLSPNAVTFSCILKACGSIGAADKGREIHAEILREGLGKDVLIGGALVDMYAKCGVLAKAQEVFDNLHVRDVVSWTALIAAYAHLGKDEIVFDLFYKMIGEGVEPNSITLTVVLKACGHSGLVDEGQLNFETMSTCYGIIPSLDHHTCMVDLFGRAGHFDKAIAVIKKMPSPDYFPMWCALLSACQKGGNVKLGRLAFEHAVQLNEKDAAAYVSMSNVYAAAGMQEDADTIEALRVKNEAWDAAGLL